jgi:hypothetical protein
MDNLLERSQRRASLAAHSVSRRAFHMIASRDGESENYEPEMGNELKGRVVWWYVIVARLIGCPFGFLAVAHFI